ncbi:hypothetical protein GCM10027422_13880 [Hymenobacter arcticus]
MLKRVLFFWVTSFGLATAGYYLLWLLLPGHRVFGAWYLMLLYHDAHPVQYIALCCFFYGPLAAGATGFFRRRDTSGRVGVVCAICAVTVGLSAPFGGMLWHFHDMQAGYFPPDWGRVLLVDGSRDGLAMGWLIVLLSIPYTLLGVVGCYFLTKAGAGLFYPELSQSPINQRINEKGQGD